MHQARPGLLVERATRGAERARLDLGHGARVVGVALFEEVQRVRAGKRALALALVRVERAQGAVGGDAALLAAQDELVQLDGFVDGVGARLEVQVGELLLPLEVVAVERQRRLVGGHGRLGLAERAQAELAELAPDAQALVVLAVGVVGRLGAERLEAPAVEAAELVPCAERLLDLLEGARGAVELRIVVERGAQVGGGLRGVLELVAQDEAGRVVILGAHHFYLFRGDQALERLERLRPGAVLDERIEHLVEEAVIVGHELERLGPGADGARRIEEALQAQVADLVEEAHLLVARRGHQERTLGVDERLRILVGQVGLQEERGAIRRIGLERARHELAGALTRAELDLAAGEIAEQPRAVGRVEVLDVILEDALERLQRAGPVAGAEERVGVAALRLQRRRRQVGRARPSPRRLVRLLGRARRARQAQEALELHVGLGVLARQHLEDWHELAPASLTPQEVGDLTAGEDVLGIELEREQVELGRLDLVVDLFVQLGRVDEELNALEVVRRVLGGLDEQLGRAQRRAGALVQRRQRHERLHVGGVDLERARVPGLALGRIVEARHRQLAGAEVERQRIGGREQLGALDQAVDGRVPGAGLVEEAGERDERRLMRRRGLLGEQVRLDRLLLIGELVLVDGADLAVDSARIGKEARSARRRSASTSAGKRRPAR